MRPSSLARWARRTHSTLAAGALVAAIVMPAAASAQASTTDPRVGLSAGLYNAGVASEGMTRVAHVNKPDVFHPNDPGGLTYANSDLAFAGNYLYQGNFSGIQVWDIANPAKPRLTAAKVCFTEQGDVSVYGHLLFVSAENGGSRLDCGTQGIKDSVSKERMLGIRIFDISDPARPKQVAAVQTCRGSHTHTLLPDPHDKGVVYVYVSGLARVRSSSEMAGCEAGGGVDDPSSALFRIEVIKVPLAHPEQAAIVSHPRIFSDLTAPATHGVSVADTANGAGLAQARRFLSRIGLPATATADDSARAARQLVVLIYGGQDDPRADAAQDTLTQLGVNFPRRTGNQVASGPSQCHDITVYPAAGLAGGACSGYGLLLDISNPENPVRIQAMADSNFAFWHSATFNNAATSMLFTDEWGGGTQAKCRASDPLDWGADAIFTITDRHLTHVGYFKMPAAQTPEENCVAHNGGLVPVPGRDIMVQAWYQGGISIYDFTDPAQPREIAYYDQGPIDSTRLVLGGYWGGYYYNGYVYGSEIARGLDVFKLTPTADLTQNEIDAAALVHMDVYNPQSQPRLSWPDAFPVARAYLDQLVRDNGLPAARTTAIKATLDRAQGASGAARRTALRGLGADLDRDVAGSSDPRRVRLLAGVVKRMSTQ
ncbi:MAG TPA: hypothetical protein VFK16_04220 [Gemmatimonadaceae bacterium]|nr:hypothetical protein [Gemmatimonadaceae bacterium]